MFLNLLQESCALANILPKYEARSTYEKEAKALNIDFKCIEATGLPTEQESENSYTAVSDEESSCELTLKTKQHGPDTIPALLRWLKGFIVHFLAQRTLEQCDFGFPTGKVAFSIIAMDGSLLSIPTSWSVMKDIISETMGD